MIVLSLVCLMTIVATVLTVYGIETIIHRLLLILHVATVLTVYGIETIQTI